MPAKLPILHVARPKKLIHFKVTKFKNATSGTSSWRVTGTKKDGTRVRKNYSNRAEAVQEQADLEVEFAGGQEHRKAARTSTPILSIQTVSYEGDFADPGFIKCSSPVPSTMSARVCRTRLVMPAGVREMLLPPNGHLRWQLPHDSDHAPQPTSGLPDSLPVPGSLALASTLLQRLHFCTGSSSVCTSAREGRTRRCPYLNPCPAGLRPSR